MRYWNWLVLAEPKYLELKKGKMKFGGEPAASAKLTAAVFGGPDEPDEPQAARPSATAMTRPIAPRDRPVWRRPVVVMVGAPRARCVALLAETR
jgi:hypothetical protein